MTVLAMLCLCATSKIWQSSSKQGGSINGYSHHDTLRFRAVYHIHWTKPHKGVQEMIILKIIGILAIALFSFYLGGFFTLMGARAIIKRELGATEANKFI
jgi:hypothetical protein